MLVPHKREVVKFIEKFYKVKDGKDLNAYKSFFSQKMIESEFMGSLNKRSDDISYKINYIYFNYFHPDADHANIEVNLTTTINSKIKISYRKFNLRKIDSLWKITLY